MVCVELKGKFGKTYSEVLSQFDIERKSLFNCTTYYFAISHAISLSETHYFHVKACLLFTNKLVII
jgi:hypothetical protein